MMNSSMDALREAQRAFVGEAERVDLKNDDELEFASSKDFWMEFLSDNMAREF